MKKIKLEVGQIWQKKGTLDTRVIGLPGSHDFVGYYLDRVVYYNIGGGKLGIKKGSFRRWIRRNKIEKPIGHYDFEKKKARVVK